jgi:hypothetical protein
MKILFAFVATLLLAGCNKPVPVVQPPAAQHWEYRVEEVSNSEDYNIRAAFQEVKTNIIAAERHLGAAQRNAGGFILVTSPGDGWRRDSAIDISKIGAEGWELVSAIPQCETIYATDDITEQKYPNVRTGKIILIFKRPIPN